MVGVVVMMYKLIWPYLLFILHVSQVEGEYAGMTLLIFDL